MKEKTKQFFIKLNINLKDMPKKKIKDLRLRDTQRTLKKSNIIYHTIQQNLDKPLLVYRVTIFMVTILKELMREFM